MGNFCSRAMLSNTIVELRGGTKWPDICVQISFYVSGKKIFDSFLYNFFTISRFCFQLLTSRKFDWIFPINWLSVKPFWNLFVRQFLSKYNKVKLIWRRKICLQALKRHEFRLKQILVAFLTSYSDRKSWVAGDKSHFTVLITVNHGANCKLLFPSQNAF